MEKMLRQIRTQAEFERALVKVFGEDACSSPLGASLRFYLLALGRATNTDGEEAESNGTT